MPYFLIFSLCLLVPHFAFADMIEPIGFIAGFRHPVLGLDHLLAMVSVGIVSTQLGGKAIWKVPLTFVLVMALGGFVGTQQGTSENEYMFGVYLVEHGIMISVIVLGITIAMDRNIPVIIAMCSVGVFAFFHGYAHGMEIPDVSLSKTYILGFMASTALLHIVGVGIGFIAERVRNGVYILRYMGATILGIGIHMEYNWYLINYGF